MRNKKKIKQRKKRIKDLKSDYFMTSIVNHYIVDKELKLLKYELNEW